MRSPAAPALDYRPFGALRLTLALLVMLQHFFAHLAPGDFALWARPFEIGTIAVLVFFALSGFVITEAADRLYQQRPIAFMLNRLLRIVPHFFTAVMLVWLAYLILARTGALSAARYEEPLSANAFGLMNVLANLLGFLPGSNRVQSDEFLLISWAIRVEMVFYVIAALWLAAASWLVKIFPVARFGLVGFGIASLLFIPYALSASVGMLQYLPYFVFGCALYFAASRRKGAAFALCAICLGLIAWRLLDRPTFDPVTGLRAVGAEFGLFALLIGAMSVLAFARPTRGRSLDRTLGDLTYPLYLYHHLIMTVALAFAPGLSWRLVVLASAASLAFAWIAQAMIDPTINRARDILRGRRLSGDDERQSQHQPTHIAAANQTLA